MKFFLPTFIGVLLVNAPLLAQDFEKEQEDNAEPERVKYALVLPTEKTPEVLKADENNPFEVSGFDGEKEGDTEENRVRDILLGMPAVGGGAGPEGMRVMLGSMRLEVGKMVPTVLPDQQVMLKVKAITANAIELVWVEKKPSGLPPKTFVIDVDVSPRVRYKMPTSSPNAGSMGVMTKSTHSLNQTPLNVEDSPPPETRLAVKAVSVEEAVRESGTKTKKPEPPANLPEASVLRMLFGNHAQPK